MRPNQSSAPLTLFGGPDAPLEEDMYRCVHCGFCLQACPTYLETGLETESPRGRIALMKAVNEGRIGITPEVYRHWDLCIQCRACESVCPSGVPYGNLIESTNNQVRRVRGRSRFGRALETLALRLLIPKQRNLALLFGGLRLYQVSGLQALVRATKLLTKLAPALSDLESSAPIVPKRRFKARGSVLPAQGDRRARVAMLSGCVTPLMHGPEMDAAARVLSRNGCEVEAPKGQVCCGAMHSHLGDLKGARSLARRNIDVFEASGVDAVISTSAGCGARLKEYAHLLRDDPDYAERAARLSGRALDIHEFLADLPFIPPTGALDACVTYQDSCHLANAQGVIDAPRAILKSIPGVEFVEMPSSNVCCGAGGAYSIMERELSLRVLQTKMAKIAESGAEIVATANPGCVLQLQNGARRFGSGVEVRYVTDLLDAAYRREEG